MSPKIHFAVSLFLALLCAVAPLAAQEKAAKGSIAGYLTLDGQPLVNARVALLPDEQFDRNQKPLAVVVTDADGAYRFAKLAVAVYTVRPMPSTYVPVGAKDWQGASQIVRLSAPGEAIANINFAFSRGGVITGRVTDADKRPMIGEIVQVQAAAGNQNLPAVYGANSRRFTTDDEGNYRIYGLPPGNYLIKVGNERGAIMAVGFNSQLPLTYAPDTPTADKARVVELKAGDEAKEVNIVVGGANRVFTIAGRLVDAETGEPLNDAYLQVSTADANGRFRASMSGFGVDKEGRFQLPGVLPGRYEISATWAGRNDDYFGEPLRLEVTDHDLEKVELKARHGLTLSGVAVVENLPPAEAAAKLAQTMVSANQRADTGFSTGSLVKVEANGSFQLKGLRPGAFTLGTFSSLEVKTGLTLVRVEQDNEARPNRVIELKAGQPSPVVKLVMRFGAGVLRGQVNFVNGELAAINAVPHITLRRVSSDAPNTFHGGSDGRVDTQGRFVISSLLAGEYELKLDFYNVGWPPLRQRVTVEETGETPVTLTFDIKKAMEGRPQ